MLPGKTTTRCFLAFWPTPEITGHLARLSCMLQRQVGGRRTPEKNIHLTLAFLGDLIPPQIEAVGSCCPNVAAPFDVTLDRIGYWRNGGIVSAGPRLPDPDFAKFAEDIRSSLRRTGLRIDKRPFVPHLTLLRKAVRRPRIKTGSMEWRIREYTLVASELTPSGSQYSILKRWSTPGDVE